jgi:AraC-like DNA-binding protein
MKNTSEAVWLEALGDPRTAVSLPLWGHHTVPASWQIDVRLREQLLYLVTAGAAQGMAEHESISLEPGSMLWAPPGAVIRLGLKRGAEPITLYRFRLRVTRGGKDLCPRRKTLLLRHSWPLRPTFHELLDELAAPRTFAHQRVRGLLQSLFVQIFRHQQQTTAGTTVLSAGQLQRLTQRVGKNPAGRLTPADLAAELKLSHDYFSRMFRATTHLSPRRWLMEERIRRAAHHILDSDQSLTHIAELFGYNDLYLFSRQFKQVMGASPRAYRMAHRR